MISKNIIGFIPARYQSSRFPGKPLVDILGKSMIQRVYEQAQKAGCLTEVVVLTDDERIFNHVISFGGKVKMTASSLPNGTARILSVIDEYSDNIKGFINIQGDEPFIDPEQIEQVGKGILNGNPVTTLKYKTTEKTDRNSVKVVCNNYDKALYFSRENIPHNAKEYFLHVGIYGFSINILKQLKNLSESVYQLDTTESLEQLKWMSNGIDIFAYTTDKKTIGIDTEEDLKTIEKLYRKT